MQLLNLMALVMGTMHRFGNTGSDGLKFLSIHVEESGTRQRWLVAEERDTVG